MKNFFKLSFLTISGLLISSCGSVPQESTSLDLDYDQIESISINWEDVFSIEKEEYYVYIYSETCGHCRQIKSRMIDYAINECDYIYFVEYIKDIKISNNYASCIGASSINDIYIQGTPTLLEIRKHVLKNNIPGSSNILEYLSIS